MNAKTLLFAMNEIDPKYIYRAGTFKERSAVRREVFRMMRTVTAAVFLLAAAAGVFLFTQFFPVVEKQAGGPGGSLPEVISSTEEATADPAAAPSAEPAPAGRYVTLGPPPEYDLCYNDPTAQTMYDCLFGDEQHFWTGEQAAQFLMDESCRDVLSIELVEPVFHLALPGSSANRYLCFLYTVRYAFCEEDGRKLIKTIVPQNGNGLVGMRETDNISLGSPYIPQYPAENRSFLESFLGGKGVPEDYMERYRIWQRDKAPQLALELLTDYLGMSGYADWPLPEDIPSPMNGGDLLGLLKLYTDLCLADFEGFEHKEGGSGMYLWILPMDGGDYTLTLSCTEAGRNAQVLYMNLHRNADGRDLELHPGDSEALLDFLAEPLEETARRLAAQRMEQAWLNSSKAPPYAFEDAYLANLQLCSIAKDGRSFDFSFWIDFKPAEELSEEELGEDTVPMDDGWHRYSCVGTAIRKDGVWELEGFGTEGRTYHESYLLGCGHPVPDTPGTVWRGRTHTEGELRQAAYQTVQSYVHYLEDLCSSDPNYPNPLGMKPVVTQWEEASLDVEDGDLLVSCDFYFRLRDSSNPGFWLTDNTRLVTDGEYAGKYTFHRSLYARYEDGLWKIVSSGGAP